MKSTTPTKGELKDKLNKAMDLLERVEAKEVLPPDPTWYRDYFTLTGDHMILTTEGWVSGENKNCYLESGDEDDIMDEVNAPKEVDGK